jgi:hypothetical protein
MGHNIQIHCIQIEDIQKDVSVQGDIKTVGKKVQGNTHSVHIANITADKRIYQLKQKNNSQSFQIGDNLIVICSENHNTGMCDISAFFNLNNGTRLVQKPFTFLSGVKFFFFGWIILAFLGTFVRDSGILLLIVLALFGTLGYFAFKVSKYFNNALKTVQNILNSPSLESAQMLLQKYDGQSKIANNFQFESTK